MEVGARMRSPWAGPTLSGSSGSAFDTNQPTGDTDVRGNQVTLRLAARHGARLILLLAAGACASGGEPAVADLTPDADGFISTASGLRYKVLQEGTGPKPTSRDRVLVHYSTRLEDGTVIDSSFERGQPDVLPLRDLIRGFREALELMSPGSHFEVIVPGRLGYGRSGAGAGLVGPNETLYFEIRLLRIEER